jgi:hypothetical protein
MATLATCVEEHGLIVEEAEDMFNQQFITELIKNGHHNEFEENIAC